MWDRIIYWLLGLSEAGAAHSAVTREKLQSIHDHAAGMLGIDCAPGSAAESIDDDSLTERDISTATRKNLPAKDFAGKNRSFPIEKPEDVTAAAAAIGRAGADNYSTDQLKKNIIRIAKRKGATYTAKLPKAWQGGAMQESLSQNDIRELLCDALDDAFPMRYAWIVDIYPDDGYLICSCGDDLYKVSYTIGADETGAALGQPQAVKRVVTYEPNTSTEPVAEAKPAEPIADATDLLGDVVPLVEKAVRDDGTIPIKLIQPGWGSSGYYSESVLKRDVPAAFPPGTPMFWNHPSLTEEADRPERDLRDLAGKIATTPTWNDDGPAGPGMYAEAKVYDAYRVSVDELAADIGLSIRASGHARTGEADGRQGPIIEKIIAGKSLDWVTSAGAGGQAVALFEAARNRAAAVTQPTEENDMPTLEELQSRLNDLEAENKRLREAHDVRTAETARFREAELLREAREIVQKVLYDADLLPMTRERLFAEVMKKVPIADGKLDKSKLQESAEDLVRHELAYLASVTGLGRITGMGNDRYREQTPAEVQSQLTEVFAGIGLSESGAKRAAQGRR